MDVCRRLAIGVKEEGHAPSCNPLFATLTSLFPVEFRPITNGDYRGLDALILTGHDPSRLDGFAAPVLPVFAAPAQSATHVSTAPSTCRLGQSAALSLSLRNLYVEEQQPLPVTELLVSDGDDVLASKDGQPVWLRRRVEEADVTITAWPLPHFSREDHIYDNFRPGRFLQVLPLVQFLRNLTDEADWQSPPTPACLLVDDPNLHSTTYGHLDFRRLATEAREKNFYVSIGSVPLDSWWLDGPTLKLFSENAPRLSIVIHGNNHTFEELARPGEAAENLALLAQALQRCRRLEQRQPGIELCRVMECPHGSLAVAMLEPMARLGYEGVLASTAHLLRCNRGTKFDASLGAERTLLSSKSLPIVPRIRTIHGWQDEVRLAAFLKRPIIVVAHHWDFAVERRLAGDFAEIVNSLPDVKWASPTGVVRACYQFRRIDDVLHLKLGARSVDVSIPDSVQWLVVHRPWLQGEEEPELLAVQHQKMECFRAVSSANVIGPIPVQQNTSIRVSSSLLNPLDCDSVPRPAFRYWPLLRKLMTELRDRSCIPVRRQATKASVMKNE